MDPALAAQPVPFRELRPALALAAFLALVLYLVLAGVVVWAIWRHIAATYVSPAG